MTNRVVDYLDHLSDRVEQFEAVQAETLEPGIAQGVQ
jgi:hypothetical protein